MSNQPTWIKPCERCGAEVKRWRGSYFAGCTRCNAQYNASGQRLRDDWAGNRSNWDDEVGDMEGYEEQQASSCL